MNTTTDSNKLPFWEFYFALIYAIIENKKKELDYSASLTEDLSADEKKTLKVLETVTGAGNIGDNGAGSHLPHAEPAGTNDAAERNGQKNNI